MIRSRTSAGPITLTPRQSEALAWMCGERRDPSAVLAARAGLPTDVEPEEVVKSQRKWPNHGVYRAHYSDGASIVIVVFTDYAGYRCGAASNWYCPSRMDDWSDVPVRWEKLDGMDPMPSEDA